MGTCLKHGYYSGSVCPDCNPYYIDILKPDRSTMNFNDPLKDLNDRMKKDADYRILKTGSPFGSLVPPAPWERQPPAPWERQPAPWDPPLPPWGK